MSSRGACVFGRLIHALLVIAGAWIVCVLWSGTALAEDDPLAEAQALYRESKYGEARAEGEKLLDGDTARDAGLLVANCDRALREYDEAIARYRALLDENGQDTVALSALTGMADALQRLGRFDEAEEALNRATSLYPEVTDARLAASGASFYTRNRAQYESAVDFARGQLRTLAARYTAAGDTTLKSAVRSSMS